MNKTQMRPLGIIPVFNDNNNFHILKSPCTKMVECDLLLEDFKSEWWMAT